MNNNIDKIISENINKFLKENVNTEYSNHQLKQNKWVPVYRVGKLDFDSNYGKIHGLFFAFDLDYYDYSDTGYDREKAEKYYLNLNANIWDPCNELKLDVITWGRIDGLTKDFEKYDIEDECQWEQPDYISTTSTDGLALAAKRLGYQAVIIRQVDQTQRPYLPQEDGNDFFDEICVFDPSIIKKVEE